ncbi:Ankyrin repeat-containing domain protein [Moelleriella libera RCEF 2490]|uniref:Ankyrin repeat-containing domain protein n=1 Tax=Moelleriella libera RCEF 2490 TaxID=1081109 RepID=A0A166UC24_9HYPO|nr:Ankyrin repeat-containing domain protein [Moelleriella libera RCEF 2490]
MDEAKATSLYAHDHAFITTSKADFYPSIDRRESRRDRLRRFNSQLASLFSSTGQPQPRAGSPPRPNAPGAPGALEHGDSSDAQGLSPVLHIPRPQNEDASVPVWDHDGLSRHRQDRLSQVDALPLDSTSVNHRDVVGRTPLLLAASWGDCDLVTRLLAGGALIDAQDIFGRTPLHAGIQHPAVVLELMKYNAALLQDANGNTPFHEVFLGTMPPRQRLQIIDIFLLNHSDVNVQNDLGLTPFWAALRTVLFREDESSWLLCIAGMLLKGADVKTLDACGVSPFEQFAKTADIGSQSDWLSNPSVKQVALLFIECGASIWTRMARDEPLAEILLGPKLTFLDHDVVIRRMCLAAELQATGDGPFLLHQVMLCGWTLEHTVDFAVLLLKGGADPNAMNSKGQTPMLLATETSGDPEFVEGVAMALMEYGADPWFSGSGEQCPFFRMFGKWPRHRMIQRILSADTIDRENT